MKKIERLLKLIKKYRHKIKRENNLLKNILEKDNKLLTH